MSGVEETIRLALSAVPAGDAAARQRVFEAARTSLERNLERIGATEDVKVSQREALARTIARIEAEETASRTEQRPPEPAITEADSSVISSATVRDKDVTIPVPPLPPNATPRTEELAPQASLAFDPSIDTARRTAPSVHQTSRAVEQTFSLEGRGQTSPARLSEGLATPSDRNTAAPASQEKTITPAPDMPAPASMTAMDKAPSSTNDLASLYDVSTGAVPPIDVSAERRGVMTQEPGPVPEVTVTPASMSGDTDSGDAGTRLDGTLDAVVPVDQMDGSRRANEDRSATKRRSAKRTDGKMRTARKGERRKPTKGKARTVGKAGSIKTSAKKGQRGTPAKRKGRMLARIASLLLVVGLGVLGWQWIESTGLSPREPVSVTTSPAPAVPIVADDWVSVFVPAADDNAELVNEGGRTVLRVSGDTTLTLDADELAALGSNTVRLAIAVRARNAQGGELAVTCRMGEGGCGRTRFPVQREATELVLDIEPASATPALFLQPGLGGEAFTLDVLDVRARGL